jgi:hypothetical protein
MTVVGAWPSQRGALADTIKSMKKYVASTTVKNPAWSNTTVIGGDLVERVAEIWMKSDSGSIRCWPEQEAGMTYQFRNRPSSSRKRAQAGSFSSIRWLAPGSDA